MPYKQSKKRPIQEKYATAMVLLRMAGADEHTINRYRTLAPRKMMDFLPWMKDETKKLEKRR